MLDALTFQCRRAMGVSATACSRVSNVLASWLTILCILPFGQVRCHGMAGASGGTPGVGEDLANSRASLGRWCSTNRGRDDTVYGRDGVARVFRAGMCLLRLIVLCFTVRCSCSCLWRQLPSSAASFTIVENKICPTLTADHGHLAVKEPAPSR